MAKKDGLLVNAQGAILGEAGDDEVSFSPQYATDPDTGERIWDLDEAERRGAWARGNYSRSDLMNRVDESNPAQSLGERIAERRRNYYYGGTQEGAKERVAKADAAGDWYGGRFDIASGEALINANNARNREAFVDVANLTNASTAAGQMRGQAANLEGVGRGFERFAAQGPGPSAAQAQLNLGTNMALSDQLALARSGRGMGESASALRSAQGNMATIQQNAANQAAILRAQEESDWRAKQLTAMGGAGNAYGAAGSTYGASGQLNLAAGNYYTGANMQNRALNDQTALGYGNQRLEAMKGGAQAELGFQDQAHKTNMGALSGSMGYEGGLNDILGVNKGIGMQGKQLAAQQQAANMGLIAQGVGVISDWASSDNSSSGTASDIREKTGVRPADAESAFEALGRYADDGYFFDPGAGIYRAEDPFSRSDTVNVGGQDIRKRDVDFDSLDQANAKRFGSDINAKKDIRGANASQAFDMRSAHSDLSPPSGVAPRSLMREAETAPYRAQDVGKSREQLEREQAFDMRTHHGGSGSYPAGVVPATIGRPAPEYNREDVGKSREQLNRERLEKSVDRAKAAPASEALSYAPAYSYRYKDPGKFGYEDKEYTGPMAQDLAKTPEGSTAVTKMPDGSLGVDTGRLALVNASATGEQAHQIDALEQEVAALRAMLGGSRMGGARA